MQAKDIPDKTILEHLAKNPERGHSLRPYTELNIPQCIPFDVPTKVILAKMRSLIRRDLVDGCACGCSGHFRITNKGKLHLANTTKSTEGL